MRKTNWFVLRVFIKNNIDMHQCITQNESVRFAGVYLRGIFSIVMLKFHKNAQNELVSFVRFYIK
jgi:hypothetical protein